MSGKLTPAERQWLKEHRLRINLDGTDWSKEPFISRENLREMSPGMATRILNDPNWRPDHSRDVFVNMKHAEGSERMRLVDQAVSILGKLA